MNFINLNKQIHIRDFTLNSSDLVEAANETNEYIQNLVSLFGELGFDIFYSLGQRNISGFIGEIYKNILANKFDNLIPNPHPDGRPDILSLDTEEIKEYYATCFRNINGRLMPIKDMLTPFQFGGLEVKCSIGSSGNLQTTRFIADYGHSFSLYEPRVGYLNGITWWAHHSNSSNLLGLYYDYYEPTNKVPQVIAALYSELSSDDWHKVSTGNPNNKKTSNTSLNKTGLQKMKSNCVFCCSDKNYVEQLRKIGFTI